MTRAHHDTNGAEHQVDLDRCHRCSEMKGWGLLLAALIALGLLLWAVAWAVLG